MVWCKFLARLLNVCVRDFYSIVDLLIHEMRIYFAEWNCFFFCIYSWQDIWVFYVQSFQFQSVKCKHDLRGMPGGWHAAGKIPLPVCAVMSFKLPQTVPLTWNPHTPVSSVSLPGIWTTTTCRSSRLLSGRWPNFRSCECSHPDKIRSCFSAGRQRVATSCYVESVSLSKVFKWLIGAWCSAAGK